MALVLLSSSLVSGLDILICVTWVAKSHFLAFSTLFKALAQKGHNVTVISHYPQNVVPQNYKNVDIEKLDILYEKLELLTRSRQYSNDKMTMYTVPLVMSESGNLICEEVLESRKVQEFLKEEHKFDLVLLEDFFADCLRPLGQMYESAMIKLVSHILAPWNVRNLANPVGSAYLPNINLQLSNRMTFFERLENSVVNVFVNFHYDKFVTEAQKDIARKYLVFDEETFDVKYHMESLILVNSHFSLNFPGPLVPNIVEVGGIHIGESQQLPTVSYLT